MKIWLAEIRDHEVIGLSLSHKGAIDAVEEWLIREESIPYYQARTGEIEWRPCGIEGGETMAYRTRRGHRYNAYVYPMTVRD